MDNRELYLHNKRRNVKRDTPVTDESYQEVKNRFPELNFAEGGIMNLRRKR